MQNTKVEITAVRPLFPYVTFTEVKSDKGTDWAIFKVPVSPGDDSGNVQILDSRLEIVDAAKIVTVLDSQRKTQEVLENLRKAKDEVSSLLNSGCVDATILQRNVVGGGASIVLFESKESRPTMALGTVQIKSSYSCFRLAFQPFKRFRMKYIDGIKRRIYYHLLIVTAKNNHGTSIWQNDPESPCLFTFYPDGKLTFRNFAVSDEGTIGKTGDQPATDYVVVAKEKPEDPKPKQTNPPPVTEAEEPPPTANPRRTTRKNGRITVACNNVDCDNTTSIAPRNVGRTCNVCESGKLVEA